MLVKVIRSQDDILTVDLAVNTIKEIYSGIELHFGRQFVDSLFKENYRYVLIDSKNPDNAVVVCPEIAGGSLEGYDALIIVRDIDGDLPAAVAVAIWAATVTAATSLGVTASIAVMLGEAAVALATIAVGFAFNAVMSLLSPTPEFGKDPAQTQGSQLNSNLFNGAVVTREQGGIVPLILGRPYCSGVLISSGISTEDF